MIKIIKDILIRIKDYNVDLWPVIAAVLLVSLLHRSELKQANLYFLLGFIIGFEAVIIYHAIRSCYAEDRIEDVLEGLSGKLDAAQKELNQLHSDDQNKK
jgi:hypothetical protein